VINPLALIIASHYKVWSCRQDILPHNITLVFFVKAELFNFFRNDLGILDTFAAF